MTSTFDIIICYTEKAENIQNTDTMETLLSEKYNSS